ncbi:MAG: PIN domain-containing protein [Bacteroidia bacterium]|nr:PIN domain-containing protein [Bacteroidia bacterium]
MNKVFLDTNIWLYAFIETQDKDKYEKSKDLILQSENIVISNQVIGEVGFNLLRKAKFSENDWQKLIKAFYLNYEVLPLSETEYLKASLLREVHTLSYWDSLIIASALTQDCHILYSEDLHHQQTLEGKLTIINPFKN